MAKNCYCGWNLVWWWFWIFGSGSDYVLSKISGSGSDSDTIEIFRSGSDHQISISAQHWQAPEMITTRFSGWICGRIVKAASHRIRLRLTIRFMAIGRDEHGSGLKPILAGSGLDRTAIFLKIGGSRLDRTEKQFVFQCDYFERIKNFSCDPILQIC